MNITKANNQYYGKYFENAICSAINKKPFVNLTNFTFTQSDINTMNSDAILCAQNLTGQSAQWIGNYTSSQNGDLMLDGKIIEVKYVSYGKGTYFNTSLEYLHKVLGFSSYREYMKEKVYPFLETYFGKAIYDNISPVSMEQSSKFRHNYPKLYQQLKSYDIESRVNYVSDLYDFLVDNPDKLSQLINDSINKTYSGKNAPDALLIFNYITKKTEIINKNTINSLKNNNIFKKTKLGLKFSHFNINIGWQNGCGLNNPTIRVFIK